MTTETPREIKNFSPEIRREIEAFRTDIRTVKVSLIRWMAFFWGTITVFQFLTR